MKRIMLFLLILSMPAAQANDQENSDFEQTTLNEEIFEDNDQEDIDNQIILSQQDAQIFEDEEENMDNSAAFGFFVEDEELSSNSETKRSELKAEDEDEEENLEDKN